MRSFNKQIVIVSLILISLIAGLVYLTYTLTSVVPHQLKVGTTYMTMNNAFYKSLNSEIEKEVKTKGDVLYTRDATLDIDQQCEHIYSFIRKGVNVLIINPIERNNPKLNQAIKKAKEAGMIIIVVDTQLEDDRYVDCTITSDNYQAGVLCAQEMMRRQDKGNILLLEHPEAGSAVERIQGFKDTIQTHKRYQIVDSKTCLGQTEIAMPQVEEVIKSGKHFDVVMALNDQGAIGALAAIKAQKVEHQVAVYGIDGSPNMKTLLADTNDVTATVAQSPVTIGKRAIQRAYQAATGKKVAKREFVEVELITKKNIERFSKTGWQ